MPVGDGRHAPGEKREDRSHGCSSSREDFDGKEPPQTLGKAYGSRPASREGSFARLRILGTVDQNVGTGIDARSTKEAACPIGNSVPDPAPPSKWSTNPLDPFVEQ